MVPKTPDSKIGVVGSTALPEKRSFTENLSIYLSSPALNSLRQNPSNFGATASHWLLYILLFFFFLILTGWMREALCVATHLYTFRIRQPTSQHPVGSSLVIPKSPHLTKAEEPSLPYYLPIAGGRIIGFIPFPCEMQLVSVRIWTRVAVSISYDDNHYTTGTSIYIFVMGSHYFPHTGGILPLIHWIFRWLEISLAHMKWFTICPRLVFKIWTMN